MLSSLGELSAICCSSRCKAFLAYSELPLLRVGSCFLRLILTHRHATGVHLIIMLLQSRSTCELFSRFSSSRIRDTDAFRRAFCVKFGLLMLTDGIEIIALDASCGAKRVDTVEDLFNCPTFVHWDA